MDDLAFIDYVESFYAEGGIYDFKFTRAEILKAIRIRKIFVSIDFEGDTIDREFIRDIVMEGRG
jgi:hypothetical protein